MLNNANGNVRRVQLKLGFSEMKVLESFNLVTCLACFGFAMWVGFGRGGFVFGDPTTTLLIVTCVLFAWTALSIALMLSPLLEAEPGSMTFDETQPYANAFAPQGVAAIIFALSFGIKFWSTAYSSTFLCALAVLLTVAFALVSASAAVSTRLQKRDAPTEPVTP